MKNIIIPILLILPFTAFGQLQFKDVVKDITLVKSFQSKIDKTEPSIISFTNPKDKDASFLINAALGYDITNLFLDRNDKLIKIYPFVEYNRNTLIDKTQHQVQSGLTLEWILNSDKKFIPVLLSDLKYVNDYKKEVESVQASLFISPKFTGVNTNFHNFYVPDNLVTLGSKQFFAFEYIPYIGLESENRIKVENDSLKGDIYRFVGKVQTNFYFFPHREDSRLKYYFLTFNISYDYRNEFSNSSLKKLENNNFWQLSANYTIYKNDDFDAKIGIDYIKGANPTKAFENQDYYGLSFKMKL